MINNAALDQLRGRQYITMTTITEADVEQVALKWLASLGWAVVHGPDIAPDTPGSERGRLRKCGAGISAAGCAGGAESDLSPTRLLEDAFRKLTRPEGSTTEARNRAFHRMLVRWRYAVEYRDIRRVRVRGDQVQG